MLESTTVVLMVGKLVCMKDGEQVCLLLVYGILLVCHNISSPIQYQDLAQLELTAHNPWDDKLACRKVGEWVAVKD